ncbi:hypothetical protein FBUS_03158 [Fasciolopsis buskii]|uniref:Uncharacterized protein n=1 Tax=Fasciolopsis buskii TaxID=27845 RepID=A0A8E0RPF4_9TREM|nr:hypothetical protein FBUS_03158 [Fasciolopsis buski]
MVRKSIPGVSQHSSINEDYGKKSRVESWSSGNDCTPSVTSLISPNSTSTPTTNSTSVGLGESIAPVVPNGVCTQTTLPISVNFIPSLGSTTLGPTNILSSTILPTSFASLTSSDFPSSSSSTSLPLSGPPLLNFSSALNVSSHSLFSEPTLSSSPNTFPTSVVNVTATQSSGPETVNTTNGFEDGLRSSTDRWPDSPGTTGAPDSVHSDADSVTMLMNVDKTEGPDDDSMLCSRCCGLSTKEDPFLVCKDCGQGGE